MAAPGCTLSSSGGVWRYDGDSDANSCGDGLNGHEYFYVYQSGDTLQGYGSSLHDDLMDGGGGDDYLGDSLAGSDIDRACDGAGTDTIAFADGDGKDHFHRIDGDNANETYHQDGGDTVDAHSGCPL
jgi:hypothetical protein